MFEPKKLKHQKTFIFNNEMNEEFEGIKEHFKNKYNVEPSNTKILGTLIKNFSIKNIERVPKSKKDIRIRL